LFDLGVLTAPTDAITRRDALANGVKVRRISLGVTIAVVGLFISRAGQGIWRSSPDSLWAAVAVISVLSATVIVLAPAIEQLLGRVTRGFNSM